MSTSDSVTNMSTEMHCRRILAAADFVADYRASHPEHARARGPSDLLNQLELDALLAAAGVIP